MAVDSNMVAQEAGIRALSDFLRYGPVDGCLHTRSTVVKALVEKGVCATRAGTKQASIDAILGYIELDTADPVVEELYPFMTHKMPKMVVGATSALTSAFSNYGTKIVSPKPAVQVLPQLFSHTDKNIRAEATKLAIELYKWLGDSYCDVLFPSLKEIQQKDLRKSFDEVKGVPPQQLRLLRSQQAAAAAAAAASASANETQDVDMDGVSGNPEDEEEMDFTDPVDVASKIPEDLYTKLDSKLWKERKAVLEELELVLNVPKMVNSDFGELSRALAKCMKDANIMVVTLAAQCVTHLAQGLKSDFQRYVDTILSPTLERTKERKQTVLDALNTALDAMFKTTTLSNILASILELTEHKTPQARIESCKYLVRCLKTTKTAPSGAEVKSIAEAALKLTGDSQEAGRTAAHEVLGVLMKIVGERAMNPFMDKLDDIKKKKVKEFYDSAEVKAKASAAPAAPAPAPAAASRSAPSAAPSRGPVGAQTPSRPSASRNPAKPLPARTPIRNAPGGTLKRRMVSPVKPSHVQPSISSISLPRDPAHNIASASSNSASTSNGGLANRVLGRVGAGSTAGVPAPRPVDSKMLAELEQLRAEKEQWNAERQGILSGVQESTNEIHAFKKIINELELTNAELREQNTQDMLALKSKETQLIRTQSDLETARTRISRLEMEVERLQARYNSATALNGGESAAPSGESDSTNGATGGLRRLTLTRYGDRHSQLMTSPRSPRFKTQQDMATAVSGEAPTRRTNSQRPLSMFAGSFDYTDKENSLDSKSGGVPSNYERSSLNGADLDDDRTNSLNSTGSGGSSNMMRHSGIPISGLPISNQRPAENWKRAANITESLRSRIEMMKKLGA